MIQLSRGEFLFLLIAFGMVSFAFGILCGMDL